MKLCRYDDDKLGVVKGDMVHDVTAVQTEIRTAAPYAMKGDAVVAALPKWRDRLEQAAGQGAGHADRLGQAAGAGGAAIEAHLRADQLPGAHRGDAGRLGAARLADRAVAILQDPGSRHVPQGELVAGRAVRGHPGPLSRPAQRPRGRAGDGDRQAGQRHQAGQGARIRRRLQPRPRHHRPRTRGPQLPQVGRRLRRARPLDGDRRRNPRPRRRADLAHGQRRDEARQQHQQPDLRLPPPDRIRIGILHALSRRPALHRHARRRRPGEAGRRHRVPVEPGARRTEDRRARASDRRMRKRPKFRIVPGEPPCCRSSELAIPR